MKNFSVLAGLAMLLGTFPAQGTEPELPGVRVEGARLYRLSVGEPIFKQAPHQWEELPAGLASSVAIRTELNPAERLRIHVEQPGKIFAVLWKWDFGFFDHLPETAKRELHGWKQVQGSGGKIRGAGQPFSPLSLYSRVLDKGVHELELLEYFGQWVIVGFRPSPAEDHTTVWPPQVTLGAASTRHHVYHPNATVIVESDQKVLETAIYQRGERLNQVAGEKISAPVQPGRYCLRVEFDRSIRWSPLTVGYGPNDKPGWPQTFFPIHFQTGWGYRGLFVPNREVLHELQTLNMFELGANTFLTDPDGSRNALPRMNALIDALGARRILALRRETRFPIREIADDQDALRIFLFSLNKYAPFNPNVVALQVDDEPHEEMIPRFKIIEQASQRSRPGVNPALLYCLLGDYAPDFWQQVNSRIRQVRAYPIRKDHRHDLQAQIKKEQADYLARCQAMTQETPLWFVIQSFGAGKKLGRWDPPSATQFRLLANLALARGIRGLTYFCWDSSPTGKEDLLAIVDHPYVPRDQALYDEVARINSKIISLQELLTSWKWVSPIEQPNPNFDVQRLQQEQGNQYAWITNWDPVKSASGAVVLVPKANQTVEVNLPPGGSQLIDLQTGATLSTDQAEDGFVSIFDGKSLAGWEGNHQIFRVEQGAIVGGNLNEPTPRNQFLCTKKEYDNFELRLKVRVVDREINAGIQIRSRRVPNHHEMIGYQADVGGSWWGKLYDESRRRMVLAGPDEQELSKVLRLDDWNQYTIRCEAKRVQLWINGLRTVDYVEQDDRIEQNGLIGLQIHSGPPGEAWYKDIEIKEL